MTLKHNHSTLAVILDEGKQSQLSMSLAVNLRGRDSFTPVLAYTVRVNGYGSMNLREHMLNYFRQRFHDFRYAPRLGLSLASDWEEFMVTYELGALLPGFSKVTKLAAEFDPQYEAENYPIWPGDRSFLSVTCREAVDLAPGAPKTTHNAEIKAPLIDFQAYVSYNELTGVLDVYRHGEMVKYCRTLDIVVTIALAVQPKAVKPKRVKKVKA